LKANDFFDTLQHACTLRHLEEIERHGLRQSGYQSSHGRAFERDGAS